MIESNLLSGDESNVANKYIVQLLIAACDGDAVTLESITRSHSELVNQLFPLDSNGASALIYAVCFNNVDVAQSLLNNHNADPDLPDSIMKYTPIMWAVHLNQLEMVRLLLDHQETHSYHLMTMGKMQFLWFSRKMLKCMNFSNPTIY